MMTIGQFAHSSGLTPKALRFYDEKGLLIPHEVDQHSAYRRYATVQLRRAATIKVLRQMGMPLSQVREALDNPDRCGELVQRHRAQLVAEYAARIEAIAHGSAVLSSYDEPVDVRVRTAPAQPWVGAVMDVDLRSPDIERDNRRCNTAFTRLAKGLREAGNPPVGSPWTTLSADADGRAGRVLTCWAVGTPVGADFAVDGLHLQHGVLPERTEAFVRVAFDDPHVASDTSADPPPSTQLIALAEHLDASGHAQSDAEPCAIRQVHVVDEDGTSTAVELTVTTGPVSASRW